jgi:hypothetical protein
VRLSERAKHAVHALIELAAAPDTLVPADHLEQAIPGKVLEAPSSVVAAEAIDMRRKNDGRTSPTSRV